MKGNRSSRLAFNGICVFLLLFLLCSAIPRKHPSQQLIWSIEEYIKEYRNKYPEKRLEGLHVSSRINKKKLASVQISDSPRTNVLWNIRMAKLEDSVSFGQMKGVLVEVFNQIDVKDLAPLIHEIDSAIYREANTEVIAVDQDGNVTKWLPIGMEYSPSLIIEFDFMQRTERFEFIDGTIIERTLRK